MLLAQSYLSFAIPEGVLAVIQLGCHHTLLGYKCGPWASSSQRLYQTWYVGDGVGRESLGSSRTGNEMERCISVTNANTRSPIFPAHPNLLFSLNLCHIRSWHGTRRPIPSYLRMAFWSCAPQHWMQCKLSQRSCIVVNDGGEAWAVCLTNLFRRIFAVRIIQPVPMQESLLYTSQSSVRLFRNKSTCIQWNGGYRIATIVSNKMHFFCSKKGEAFRSPHTSLKGETSALMQFWFVFVKKPG